MSARSPLSSPTSRRSLLVIGAALAGAALAACSSSRSSSSGSASTAASATPSSAAPSSSTSAPGSAPATASSPSPGSPLTKQATITEEPADATDSQDQWGSEDSHQEPSLDASLVISDFRVGRHEGYDRVVVEMEGPGSPGWNAMWMDQAATQGKGEPIELGGEYVLVVYGTGATMPVEAEQQAVALAASPGVVSVDGDAVAQAHLDLTFESQFQVSLGTHSQDYRVFTLQDPTRLVIDVKRP